MKTAKSSRHVPAFAVALAGALAALIAGVATPARLWAAPEVRLRVLEADQRSDANPEDPPWLWATVIGVAPGMTEDKVTLVQTTTAKPISVRASRIVKYVDGPETMALVVLLEGHELWMGNGTYAESADDTYVGTFPKLSAMFEALQGFAPKGSLGGIVVYSQGAEVKMELADLSQLSFDRLGSQRDYQFKTSRDLVTGVQESLSLLAKASTSRKVLLVVGDGADTNPDSARSQLSDLRKKAEGARVEIFAVQLAVENLEPGEPGLLKALTPNVKRAANVDALVSAVRSALDDMTNRFYVEVQGYDRKTKRGFRFDGQDHDFMLRLDQEELDAGTLSLPKWSADKPKKSNWLLWLAVAAGLCALVLIIVLLRRGKQAAPVVVPAASAVHDAPMKTVMIGAGGDESGYPMVGWLVPLNGAHQYQTFRLESGVTKLGTGGECHIALSDTFLSTEHCKIHCSPTGFIVQDNHSTNGTYVNDQRIERHELIDNDVITMGRTRLKFKSIN